MHAATTPGRLPLRRTDELREAVPDRLPKPPAHPPAEPIIIKVPPQPREVPEIDRPHDEKEDDAGIHRVPWPPDMPPPQPPEERPRQTPVSQVSPLVRADLDEEGPSPMLGSRFPCRRNLHQAGRLNTGAGHRSGPAPALACMGKLLAFAPFG